MGVSSPLLLPNGFWIPCCILTQSNGGANRFHWNRLLSSQGLSPLESEAETLLRPASCNPRWSTWRWVFMGHLAKSFRQTFVPPETPKSAAKERYPYRHDALLAPALPEQLVLFAHSSNQWGKKDQSSSLCSVKCSVTRRCRWASEATFPYMGAVPLQCCCQSRAGDKARVVGPHPLCRSPHMPQPCGPAFIAVTPLPHLLSSILQCSFIRTALRLPSWASHPSKEDKRG